MDVCELDTDRLFSRFSTKDINDQETEQITRYEYNQCIILGHLFRYIHTHGGYLFFIFIYLSYGGCMVGSVVIYIGVILEGNCCTLRKI
jgi:hypothetical protein